MIPQQANARADATIDDIVEHMHESRERGLLSVRGFGEEERFVCAIAAPFYESLAVDHA